MECGNQLFEQHGYVACVLWRCVKNEEVRWVSDVRRDRQSEAQVSSADEPPMSDHLRLKLATTPSKTVGETVYVCTANTTGSQWAQDAYQFRLSCYYYSYYRVAH